MKRIVTALTCATFVTGCAATPDSIAPAYVSEVGYQNWSCQQLAEEQSRLSAAYAMAASAQEKARSNDTMGVIFLGLPVSSMSGGNVAPQIASIKGQQEATRKAMILKSCSVTASAP